jgi:hypothetical protein
MTSRGSAVVEETWAGTRRSVKNRNDKAMVDGNRNLSMPQPVARAIKPE